MKRNLLKLLCFFASWELVSCGPPAPEFSIMPVSVGTYQGNSSNSKVDILWVVDNSGSMLTKQQSLATSFSSFTSLLTTKGFDFQMAIITTDTRSTGAGGQAGIFQGTPKVISQSTSNWSSTFQSNVVVGNTGDSSAKALDAIKLALSTSLLNGSNTGFIRSAAHLAVIIVSDDDDNDSTATTSEVETFLEALKPSTTDSTTGKTKRNYSVSAVIQDTTKSGFSTCAAPSANGVKFRTIAADTDGTEVSICEADFSSGLSNLSKGVAEVVTQILLSREPDVSKGITVTFNGSSVPNNSSNGWTYDSSNIKIVFHGNYIPSDGTYINIYYTPKDIIR